MHAVSFSSGGDKLAWVSHNSSVSVVLAANKSQIFTVRGDFLPLISCIWISDNSIVCAGKLCRQSNRREAGARTGERAPQTIAIELRPLMESVY